MAMTLITTNAETNAASSSFTSSIDSTYKLYIFKFYDINPATDAANFTFQVNASSQSGYNETITSSFFSAYHAEDDGSAVLNYEGGQDQAQGTAFQVLAHGQGNGSDESCAGELYIFNPSSTTYVTHFYSRGNGHYESDLQQQLFPAGYINVTAAITNVQFKMSSGNFDGTIKMYGVG